MTLEKTSRSLNRKPIGLSVAFQPRCQSFLVTSVTKFLVLHPRTPPLNCSYSEDVIWQLCPLNSPRQKARLLHKPQSPWNPQKVPEMLPWHLSAEMLACAVWFAPPNVYIVCFQPVPVCHIPTVTLACAVMHINTVLKRGGCSFYLCVRLRVHCYPAVSLSTALRKHAGQLFRPASVWWERRINTCLVE